MATENNSADDVCAASADPCVVVQEVDVVAGSRLDFGLRTLRIQGAGLLDFGAGDAEVACGRLEVATSAVAIRSRGGDSAAIVTVTLLVRRRCSLAPAAACSSLTDGTFDHSTETPLALIGTAHFSVSSLTSLARYSGVA